MQHPPYNQPVQNQYRQPYHTQWAGPQITPQPPFPPPPMKPQKRQKALWVLIAVSLLILLPCIGYLYAPQITASFISIEPSCTVGVTGTAAAVTFQGWQASQACTAGMSTSQSTPGSVYLLDSPPDEPVVCQVDRNNLRITVRDQGILKLVGNALCQGFLSPTPRP